MYFTSGGGIADVCRGHETSFHASKLSGLEDGTYRLAIGCDRDGTVVGLVSGSIRGSRSSRVGDHVVGGVGSDTSDSLRENLAPNCNLIIPRSGLEPAYQVVHWKLINLRVAASRATINQRHKVAGHVLRRRPVAIGNDINNVLCLDRSCNCSLDKGRARSDGSADMHLDRRFLKTEKLKGHVNCRSFRCAWCSFYRSFHQFPACRPLNISSSLFLEILGQLYSK